MPVKPALRKTKVPEKSTKVRDLFRPPNQCGRSKAQMLYIWAHRGSPQRMFVYNRHCERCKTCRQLKETYYADCSKRKGKEAELEGISSFVYFLSKTSTTD